MSGGKGLTKSQLVSLVAEKTDLRPVDVKKVFESLAAVTEAELKKGHPVTIPDLVKIKVHDKKATPARSGRNPFTGEAMTIKAKPARKVIKAKPVKNLKDLV